MKRLMPMHLVCLAILLLLISSCVKRQTVSRLLVEPPSSACKIQWIAAQVEGENDPGLYPDTLRFSYDSSGYLITISRFRSAGLTYSNYTFWYDSLHRVTDVITTGSLPAATGDAYRTWHKLYYTGDKVTLDSLFVYGLINGTRPNGYGGAGPNLYFVSTYLYDSLDRIKEATDLTPATYTQTSYFTYGATGNLTRATRVSGYISTPTSDTTVGIFALGDSHVNPTQDLPIFQFLSRNYSKNNQFLATAYNSDDLPTIIPMQGSPYLGHLREYMSFAFLGLNDPLTINYNCEMPALMSGKHAY
jgi:hypothetical protein